MSNSTQKEQFERKPSGVKSQSILVLCGLILACFFSISCETNDEVEIIDTQEGFAIDFDYTQREMLGFSIEEYLTENASHLLPYAEMISHVAGEKRISPRALMALMEKESGALGNPQFDETRPFGTLSQKTGFLAQLRDVGSRLRSMGESAQLRVLTHSPQGAVLAVLSSEGLLELGDLYQELFPGVVSQPKPVGRASSQIPLQFPYSIGETWYFGGTHSDAGKTMSSLDFNDNGEDWGDTISSYVVSSAAGTVKKHSSCYLTVIHADGWMTSYYHMSNLLLSTGAAVKANQAVGKYANTESQALCDGGWSTGPHVHWSLYKDNNEVNLLNVVLSGYSVHPGTFDYDDDCSRMWYTNVKTGKKVCPWTAVRNDGVSAPVDNCPNDPNKTEPGLCGCGVPEGTCPIASPRIEMSKSTYAVNEAIVVKYFNLPGNAMDWVGIYAAGAADTAELQYLYSNGAKSGTLSFTGRVAGSYEARLFFNDTYTRQAKVSFTVSSSSTDQCPSDPNKTSPGICGCGVADTDTDKDGTANCKDSCPSDPAKTVPGVCGCGVPEGTCSQGPSISMSKSTYAVGETIKVNFTGMSGSSTDWIGLFKTGAANTAHLTYQYTGSGKLSGTLSFSGRSAGSFEARLFLNDSYTLKKKVSFIVK